MCKRCKRNVFSETKAGVPADPLGFLVDGLCPQCYTLERVRPIDKEMNQCEATLASLRAARFHAFKQLEDAKQAFLKAKSIASRLAVENPWWCKCGRSFKHEPEYVSHAYQCQGRLPETRKERASRSTKEATRKARQEISI